MQKLNAVGNMSQVNCIQSHLSRNDCFSTTKNTEKFQEKLLTNCANVLTFNRLNISSL